MTGKRVSHFRLLDELGHGGMGVVWLAEDESLGRKVALKFCKDADDPQRRRFLLEEARAAAELEHPNIARVYELGEDADGTPFIAMELIAGSNLAAVLKDRRLDVAEACRIARQVASGLGAAHWRNILHRDIKPSNIRITESGDVKLVDFGLAARVRAAVAQGAATMTLENTRRGTPPYMSPEQARGGDMDGRSDLFSLGVVLYESLTGERIFEAPTVETTLDRVATFDPPPPSRVNPKVSPALDRVVMRLLEKDRDRRFQSAAEVVAALDALSERAPLSGRRFVVPLLAALVLAVVSYFAWARLSVHHAPPDAVRYYQQALYAMQDGTYYKAAMLLESAVKIDDRFTMAHALLAEAWDEMEYAERANREMVKASDGGRVTGRDALRLDAVRQTVAGDYQNAAASFRKIAGRSDGSERAEALLDLGRVLEKAENTKEALAAYLESARIDPLSAAAQLRAGTIYVRQLEPGKAESALNAALDLYRGAGKTEGETECLYQLARFKDQPTALDLLKRALEAARVSHNEQQQIKVLLLQSYKHVAAGDIAASRDEADAAVKLARRIGVENFAARGLIDLGNTLRVSDPAKSREYLDEALAIAKRSGARRTEARAAVNLAGLLYDQGDLNDALQHAQDALRFYAPGGYAREAASAQVIIGRVKQAWGDYANANSAFAQARDAVQGRGPSPQLALAQEGLASVAEAQQQFEEALGHYADAYATYTALPNASGAGATAGSIADVNARLGNDKQATAVLDRADADAQGTGRATAMRYIEIERSFVAYYAGRYQAAANLLKQQIASGEYAGGPLVAAEMTRGLALARSGSAQQGYELCVRARDAAAKIGDLDLAATAAVALAEAAIRSGRREEGARILSEAIPDLEKRAKQELLWRAWALASTRPDDDAASRARRLYAQLTTNWPADVALHYSARPGIRELLAAIHQKGTERA